MQSSHAAPWWAVVAVLMSSISITVVSLIFALNAAHRAQLAADQAAEAQRRAEQQWCSTVRLQDDAYRAIPPESETGQKLARGYATLRAARCPG